MTELFPARPSPGSAVGREDRDAKGRGHFRAKFGERAQTHGREILNENGPAFNVESREPTAEPGPNYYAQVSVPISLLPPQSFEYAIPAHLAQWAKPGYPVEVPMRQRKVWGIIESISLEPVFKGRHHEVLRINPIPETIHRVTWPIVQRLSSFYGASLAQSYRSASTMSSVNWNSEQQIATEPPGISHGQASAPPTLSSEQQECLTKLETPLSHQEQASYLWGPTGSGKTYVIIRYLWNLLKSKKSAIYLVPEISLTPQFLDLFKRELPQGTPIVCWHSGITTAQKRKFWPFITQQHPLIVLGTRSSIFLPIASLGSIIVDEEQDSSFKQDTPAPCYHARTVGLWRAQEEHVRLILASATPSLEAYHGIKQGLYQDIRLTKRYGPSQMPRIIVNAVSKKKSKINDDLLHNIKQTMDSGGHILIYHNRRGHSRVIECLSCKETLSCRQCDLPLTLHKEESQTLEKAADRRMQEAGKANSPSLHEPRTPNPEPRSLGQHPAPSTQQLSSILKCHHCGIRRKTPDSCPKCHAPKKFLSVKGLGTQKLSEELTKILHVKPLRLDSDTSGQSAPIYEEFKLGKTQILIGTKLVTKGWHFPKITLSAVLDADTELSMPDFRACERTFQTLMQVAGRSGRGEKPGALWLGSRRPHHYIFKSLQSNDPILFYEHELHLREQMRLPPWSRLISIELRGKERNRLESAANILLEKLRFHIQDPSLEALGAAPAFYQKIRGYWRFEILLRLNNPDEKFPWDQIAPAMSKARQGATQVRIKPDPENLF